MKNNNMEIRYGSSEDEVIKIKTLTDKLRFIECMKLYKAFDTLENALKNEAKEEIKKYY